MLRISTLITQRTGLKLQLVSLMAMMGACDPDGNIGAQSDVGGGDVVVKDVGQTDTKTEDSKPPHDGSNDGDMCPSLGGLCVSDADCPASTAKGCSFGTCECEYCIPNNQPDGPPPSGSECETLGGECKAGACEVPSKSTCEEQTDIPVKECQALMALYNDTKGSSWTTRTNWTDMTAGPCSWHGVTCTSVPGNVEALGLDRNNLDGAISAEIGALTSMTTLELEDNQKLTGAIPKTLGGLGNLKVLRLGYNQLTGAIPVELALLTKLERLRLRSNQLTGSIPVELGALTNLIQLSLDGNQLSGSIPTELGALTQLTHLSLASNQLAGNIPAALGDLTELRGLWLQQNNLGPFLPGELANATKLEYLWLSQNILYGNIPVEFGSLTQLKELYLSANQFPGPIPKELGALSDLEVLSLANNMFSGTIPAELGALTKLRILTLGNNTLSGVVPSSIAKLTSLTDLDLCNQFGTLTADSEDGKAFRSITNNDWPVADQC